MKIVLQPTRLSGGKVKIGGESPSFGPIKS
jgi:hypothetical protein